MLVQLEIILLQVILEKVVIHQQTQLGVYQDLAAAEAMPMVLPNMLHQALPEEVLAEEEPEDHFKLQY
jgi:hypothetical protein